MAMYEWSEVFMSIEGEARYSGHPTVYIRFARCNFQCRGFNNPDNNIEPDGYATLSYDPNDRYGDIKWDPKDYKTLESIPLIHKGCDSQYAVNHKFFHMWHKGDENVLAAEVIKVLPHNRFENPITGKRVILSLTGGEPTIRIKFWLPILEILYQHGLRSILIETNCAAPLRDKDLAELYSTVGKLCINAEPNDPFKIIWSNSPKLISSGETWKDAIRPEIALKQIKAQEILEQPWPGLVNEQYFKFVCGPNEQDFYEVKKAMNEYYEAGIPRSADVYIMPVACTEEQQQEIASKVAKMCIDKGYIYCHRLQNSVFGNGVGT